jgi:hypothetical protein
MMRLVIIIGARFGSLKGKRQSFPGERCKKLQTRLLVCERAAARKVLGWPKICKLAHAFRWECSYKRLKLAQLLGQLGVFLTRGARAGFVVPEGNAATLEALCSCAQDWRVSANSWRAGGGH